MVKSTQIARIDGIFCIYELWSTQLTAAPGLMLAASVDDEQVGTPDFPREYSFGVLFVRTIAKNLDALQSDAELTEPKQNAKMVIRRLNRNSEPQASIEAGQYTLQCVFSLLSALPNLGYVSSYAQILTHLSFQLPNLRLRLLSLHLRSILPPQTSLHLPFRPLN